MGCVIEHTWIGYWPAFLRREVRENLSGKLRWPKENRTRVRQMRCLAALI